MTVKLQALAIKSKIKVVMRYKKLQGSCYEMKNRGKPKDVTKDCVFL